MVERRAGPGEAMSAARKPKVDPSRYELSVAYSGTSEMADEIALLRRRIRALRKALRDAPCDCNDPERDCPNLLAIRATGGK